MSHCIGEPINFEFSSSDASTAAPLILRDAGGTGTRTLLANERVTITAITAAAASGAGLITIFSDNDASGDVDADETMIVFNLAIATGNLVAVAGVGITPSVLAAGSGAVEIAGSGYITKG